MASTSAAPDGSTSSTATPVADADPSFFTLIEYVMSSPAVTGSGASVIVSASAGPAGGLPQPSAITSKSSALSDPNAGFRTSLFQCASIVPVVYMSLPLSATIKP